MSYKEDLKKINFIVLDNLSNYIKANDYIHDECHTFESVLKNMSGKGVPMEELLRKSETLILLWDSIYGRMMDFRTSSYLHLTTNEKLYFETLLSFVVALKITVACLVDRQQYMVVITNSMFHGPMIGMLRWIIFIKKNLAYRYSIYRYCKIGQKLDTLKPIVLNHQ